MNNFRKSILATIIYYDIFNFPLTFAEIWKCLINPARFIPDYLTNSSYAKFISFEKIDVCDILEELEKMVAIGLIKEKNGFYFLRDREELYEKRIEKDKIANKKWKKFLSIVKYLQLAPYLRGVFASGSLAINNTELTSDFDVFIILKSNRLYTGRFFLWLISSILRARRKRFEFIAPDKLCFNHYVTEDNLEFSHRSLYIAQYLINIRPVLVPDDILTKFVLSNSWINIYCLNFKNIDTYRNLKFNRLIIFFAKTIELILNNFLGDLLENILRFFQQRRIKNNPITYESGGRIIYNKKELEFHPRSFEKVVIEKYNANLERFGISTNKEVDSGLN